MADIRTAPSSRNKRVLEFEVNGTGTAAITSGDLGEATLADNGNGEYTLTFTTGYYARPRVFVTPITDSGRLSARVDDTASSASAVKIEIFNESGTLTDAKFNVMFIGEADPY